MDKIIAIIPARGGSVGIPRKNIIPVCGKPLIAWCIEELLQTNSIGDVYVTSDDFAILDVANNYGAVPILRPPEISSNSAASEDALLHALDFIKTKRKLPETFLFVQATSPLTLKEDFDGAYAFFNQIKADSLFTGNKAPPFVWGTRDGGEMFGFNHTPHIRLRRQDRSDCMENGAFYVLNTKKFIQSKHRFFGKIGFYSMPKSRSLEIDDFVDLFLVESLLRIRDMSERKLENINAIAFDFDGVFTDNLVYVDQAGTESVCCNKADGLAIEKIKETKMLIAVFTSETKEYAAARCNKLKIPCYNALKNNKLEKLKTWCFDNKIQRESLLFVGNDVNDLACLKYAGCAAVPQDAAEEVKKIADIVLTSCGGGGVIREIYRLLGDSCV